MRLDRLDLNLLVAFDALLDERNVSAAAKRLFLSQSALSGSLARLREFFDDELLVQAGRIMVLTPRAEQLAIPVREALTLIRTRITTPATFEPGVAQRHFRIVASDYLFSTLLAEVIGQVSHDAPGLTFEVIPTDRQAVERIERGEADILITLAGYVAEQYASHFLFRDSHAVIAWNEGRYGRSLDRDGFLAAGHAVAYFGVGQNPAFTETLFQVQGDRRRIEVRLPTHAALPQAVIGTDRLATMYLRHAAHFARFLPIRIHPMPIDLPDVAEFIQWHPMRDKDQGLRWLVDRIEAVARKVNSFVPDF